MQTPIDVLDAYARRFVFGRRFSLHGDLAEQENLTGFLVRILPRVPEPETHGGILIADGKVRVG